MSGFNPKLPVPIRDIDDINVMRAFDKYRESLSQIFSNPLLSGVIITAQTITAGQTNLVKHTLGRKYRGWWITDLPGNSVVFRVASSTDDPSIYLPLNASVTVTINLWVF